MVMIRSGLLSWLVLTVIAVCAAVASRQRRLGTNCGDAMATAPCDRQKRSDQQQQPLIDASLQVAKGIMNTCVNINNGTVRVINANQTCVESIERAVPLTAAATSITDSSSPVVNGSSVTITGENSVSKTGGNLPLNVMQPYLPINYIIALQGIFPTRPSQDGRQEEEKEEAVKHRDGGGKKNRQRKNRRPLTDVEPFIGEIQLFAGEFAPKGWFFCNGTLLAVAYNRALFALIGNTYGGDGVKSFALPDLRGRVPIGTSYSFPLGAPAGFESVTLFTSELASHSHTISTVTGTITSSQA